LQLKDVRAYRRALKVKGGGEVQRVGVERRKGEEREPFFEHTAAGAKWFPMA